MAVVPVDAALALRWPLGLAWSRDANTLAYQVMGATGGEVRLYDVAADHDRRVVQLQAQASADLRWSRDGDRVIYKDRGGYASVGVAGGGFRTLFPGLAGDLVRLSPDERAIWLIREGDLWVQRLDEVAPRRLSRGEDYLARDVLLHKRLSFCQPRWSPDAGALAYVGRVAYGGAARNTGAKVVVVSAAGETLMEIVPESGQYMFTTIDWSPDGRRIAVARSTEDYRRKELIVASLDDGAVHRVWVDTDDRWVGLKTDATYNVAWSPDGGRLSFLSIRDGYRHLSVVDVASGTVAQLTAGDHDVRWSAWSPDRRAILILSNEKVPQRYVLSEIPSTGGARTRLLDDDTWLDPRASLIRSSPDGRRIAFGFSAPRLAFAVGVLDRASGRVSRAYSGALDAMTDEDLAERRPVSFLSADDAVIPAVLISARRPAEGARPAIVYAYGGGGQHATLDWGLRSKAILLNYLAQAGYAVLIVDPRGSSGYGDAHEKGLFHDAAGKQSEDLAAAVRFLAREGFDPARVAILGHSYGAFLAVQTLIQSPGVFAACIAAAGKYDWRSDWQGSPVEARFGPPATSAALIRQRSPIFHADEVTAPLLLLHGTADMQEPYASTADFVTELLKAGKPFEFMTYPGEGHDLGRLETQRDLMRRIERFLRASLMAVPDQPAAPRRAPLAEAMTS